MLWLVERYNYLLAMDILKRDKQYKIEKDMFEILCGDEVTNNINNINPYNDIIISIPEKDNILSRNIDGTLAIKTQYDINLSGHRIINNNIAIIEHFTPIKMSIPKSIRPECIIPMNNKYCNTIYKSINVIPKMKTDAEIPNYIIYENLNLIIYIDIELIKRSTGTLVIKKNTELCSLLFTPIYFIGSHDFQMLNKIYILKNDEIVKTFNEVF